MEHTFQENFCEIKKLENNSYLFNFGYQDFETSFNFTNNSCRWLSKKTQVLINANFNTVELYVNPKEPGYVYVKWHQCSSMLNTTTTKPNSYYQFVVKLIDLDKFFS